MILVALLLAQSTPTTAPTDDRGVVTAPDGSIIVFGRRGAETGAALDRCLARHCPPKVDIAATLAHAEALFLEGDYLTARGVLGAGRARNRRYAKDAPVEVSNLLNALARLSSLTGWRDRSRLSAIESADALKAGLPADDPRILEQELVVAGEYVRAGRYEGAQQAYQAVRRRAERSGAIDVQARAMLELAVMYTALAQPLGYGDKAKALIAEIARLTDPRLQSLRDTVPYLQAQMVVRTGDERTRNAAIAALPKQQVATPLLVYAPPIELNLRGNEAVDRSDGPVDNFDLQRSRAHYLRYDLRGQWADLGFRVRPDGTVGDVQVLRSGPNLWNRWVSVVQRAIGKRRYQPLALGGDPSGFFKIERYSFVSDVGSQQGSRLTANVGAPHLEMVDLTLSDGKGVIDPAARARGD